MSTASAASLGGSLVEILAFLWVGATGAWETLCFGEGRLPLTVVALGAAIILRILKWDREKINHIKIQCRFITSTQNIPRSRHRVMEYNKPHRGHTVPSPAVWNSRVIRFKVCAQSLIPRYS